jgi:hypothetical protein
MCEICAAEGERAEVSPVCASGFLASGRLAPPLSLAGEGRAGGCSGVAENAPPVCTASQRPPPQPSPASKRGREEGRAVEENHAAGKEGRAAEETARQEDYAAMASAESSACDDVTDPKMPPCALIMARPASWKCGKYEPQQSESTIQR